ncbi:hypothetical protein H6P81_016057 [Aristolochia fimbriata]|uniref:Uncharacterized protein n=1 Tax=Aristolochia fimbriata TaxID=158543 RepID=A0AAV7EB08_ARIFI|nr:hypothetical protein H6P81_016057 [Aristolochia fimbriata]
MTTGRINQVASSSRDRDASTRRCEKAPQHRARGIDGRKQKLGDQTRFANPTKSIGTAAFTWVHEHSWRPGVSSTPGAETKPEGENAPAPIAPACTASHGSGPGDGFKGTIHQRRAAPFGKKHTSTRGMPATQRGRGRARKIKKTRSWAKRVAGPLGPFPARRAEGHRLTEARANGLCTAPHAEGQAIAQSRWGNKPFLGARGRQAFPQDAGANSARLPPPAIVKGSHPATTIPLPPI